MSEITLNIQTAAPGITLEVCVPSPDTGTTIHNELTGRDSTGAHPASSIELTGVEWADVQAMATAVDDNEIIDFDGETIIGAGTEADPYRVDQRVKFFDTEQNTSFTITETMVFTVVEIDSLTNIDVTLANIGVGEYLSFDIISTGYPNFLASATQRINNLALNEALLVESDTVMITRKEDHGTNEVYEILGGTYE